MGMLNWPDWVVMVLPIPTIDTPAPRRGALFGPSATTTPTAFMICICAHTEGAKASRRKQTTNPPGRESLIDYQAAVESRSSAVLAQNIGSKCYPFCIHTSSLLLLLTNPFRLL